MVEAEGEAVHAPGLPPGPAGAVAVPLGGAAEPGLPGVHVHVEGVEGGVVLAHQVFLGLLGVAVGGGAVFPPPGQPGRLVQQGQVQQAVDDHPAPVGGVVQIPPGLDDPGLGEVPGQQVVRRLQEAVPGPPVLPEQDRWAAGQAVEEAQVVGVHIPRLLHPPAEGRQVGLQGVQVLLVPRVLPQQPQHTGVKGGGPVKVLLLGGVGQPLAAGGGEAVPEPGQKGVHLLPAEVQLGQHQIPVHGGGAPLHHHRSSFPAAGRRSRPL